MVKITFIMSSIGEKPDDKKYVKTWQMEPLPIAALAALTPSEVEREFYDDRIEDVDYTTDTDLVVMTVETYTARRSYEIARRFRERGVRVVMGGFHVTLMPGEARNYADSIVIGEAENIWPDVLRDARQNKLKKIYKCNTRPSLEKVFPDRSIFQGKKYMNLGLVETGRGCGFQCDFCSITKFYNHSYTYRPVEDVTDEIRKLSYKNYFFVDDNFCADLGKAKQLAKALIPLKIRWVSQGSINMAKDLELLDLMKKSGCAGVLIGFESLNKMVLKNMNKGVNIAIDIEEAIKKIHNAGLGIYAVFLFGYGDDTPEVFEKTYRFALKHKFFSTAFNHLVPMPGTPLYERLKSDNRLLDEKWWLNHSYSFGDVVHIPENCTPEELSSYCYAYRKKFFSISSIAQRFFNFEINFSSIYNPFLYLFYNFLMRFDVSKKQGIPLGTGEEICCSAGSKSCRNSSAVQGM